MPDLAAMLTFVLTVEKKNLVLVARQLKKTPAAVSKQLSRLEEEIGLQLLIRSTRHIEITQIGIDYCLHCQRVLEEAEIAAAFISNSKQMPHGELKILSGRHFAKQYIIPHLKEFLELYPRIQLDLELAERIPDFQTEMIDVLIGMSLQPSGDVIQKKIASTTYVFCASPAYLEKYNVPKKPSDLKMHRYLTHRMRNPDNDLDFGNQGKVILNPYLKVNDAETLVQLALEGMGIVKLHEYVVNAYLKEGLLQKLLLNYPQKDLPIYIAYPQRKYVPSKVRCFIEFMTMKVKNTEEN